jgi:phosphoribosylformylglycinamidine (FGAM) synthase PurS component
MTKPSMFVKSIASVSKQNIVEKLQSAKFISLTMDGSTDFTGDDLESIDTRSCSNGIIEDNYLYIGEININMDPK